MKDGQIKDFLNAVIILEKKREIIWRKERINFWSL